MSSLANCSFLKKTTWAKCTFSESGSQKKARETTISTRPSLVFPHHLCFSTSEAATHTRRDDRHPHHSSHHPRHRITGVQHVLGGCDVVVDTSSRNGLRAPVEDWLDQGNQTEEPCLDQQLKSGNPRKTRSPSVPPLLCHRVAWCTWSLDVICRRCTL